jgi:hypothetical protein
LPFGETAALDEAVRRADDRSASRLPFGERVTDRQSGDWQK